jgi:23S rRNA (uracil1939-C5)-methyltransferase
MRYIHLVRKPRPASRGQSLRSPKHGEIVEVRFADLDDEGAGIGDLDGLRLHVAGALPGETATARLVHRSPHRPEAWAELVALSTRSPDRVDPVCPAYGPCGGCVLQHFQYEAQRTWKRSRVAAALADASLGDVPVAACVAAPRPLGYRNRSKLVCAGGPGDGLLLGAFKPRTHEVVDLAGCRVAEAPLDDVRGALRSIVSAAGIVPYDERLATGTLRHVVLRVNSQGEVLCVFVTAHAPDGPPWAAGVALADRLMAARGDVVGCVENRNPGRTNAIFGATTLPLAGRQHLDETVGGVTLRLSPTAFFQVNRDVATLLYADVLAATGLTGTERVVDCYSGVGGLALTLAPRAAEVIGIEEHPGAVADARASALHNHATRARFLEGDAAARLAEIDVADVVVLNPPRRGCDPAVLAQVVRLGPRLVVYVSCAPDTLARDLALLAKEGYRTRAVRPYDMLPQTPHVEALAVITR